MTSRAEVTTRCATAYANASKKDKGRVLHAVTEVTGRSRDNARRRLTAAVNRPAGSGQVAEQPRVQRAPGRMTGTCASSGSVRGGQSVARLPVKPLGSR